MRDEVTPQEEGGQDAQRGREPSIGRQQTGERQPPRDNRTTSGALTPNHREPRHEASTSTLDRETMERTTEPANGQQTRLRNEPRGRVRQPQRRKQTLKAASLNINGNGARTDDKWGSINNVMKTRKIAVLAAQETHPTGEVQERVQKRFRSTLHFIHSADPDEPGSRNGVTIILNKNLIKTTDVSLKTIIEGRVIMITIPWNGEDTLTIMNIYAPARNSEKEAFWTELNQKLRNLEGPNPDLVMGDFNLVENPGIDRLANSGNSDPTRAQDALSEFTTELNLADGWRRRHPRERNYTYTGQTQSRLDRVYAREEIYPWCTEWAIEHPAVKTDH